MDKSLSAALLEQLQMIPRSGMKYIIFYLVLWAGPYIYIDLEMPDSTGAFFLMSFVGIGLNFFLLYSLMQCSDARDEGTKTGIASFFGLGILHSFAIFIGLALLVLPGIFLALRWLPAFARLLNSDEGVMEALRWSWERTSGKEVSLAIPFLGVIVLYVIGMGSYLGLGYLYEFGTDISVGTLEYVSLATVVFSNLVMALGLVWYTLLGVASYVCFRNESELVAESFD